MYRSFSFDDCLPNRVILCTVLCITAVGFGVLRIVASYATFCHTADEPCHISRGMEWWTHQTYSYIHHPPLAPIMFGIGPILDGTSFSFTGDKSADGNRVLYANNRYARTLTLARMGNLTFFVLASIGVGKWAERVGGRIVSLLAVVYFTNLPPVLGHSGIATNDLAITATTVWAAYSLTCWFKYAQPSRAIMLGVWCGLSLIAKFSSVVFLPVVAIASVIARVAFTDEAPTSILPRKWLQSAIIIVVTSGYVVWAGYLFSFGRASPFPYEQLHKAVAPNSESPCILRAFVNSCARIPLPAPEFFQGLQCLAHKQTYGHTPYFLGRRGDGSGSLWFFPVVFSVKTPLVFIFASVIGAWYLIEAARMKRDWRLAVPVLIALGMFVAVLPSNINLGIRHLLPIYPILSIVAAYGTVGAYSVVPLRRLSRSLVLLALLMFIGESMMTHPDYLPYFNVLAGETPEDIVVDSDLDWGQDLLRLNTECQRRHIGTLYLSYFGTAEVPNHLHCRMVQLRPNQPVSGWVAISVFNQKVRTQYSWLEEHQPIARVGRSILLYNIP